MMNITALILDEAPALSDESASDVLDFLYLLVEAFEQQYSPQLRRHYQSKLTIDLPQPDLFEDFDDELPDF
jgi:hypothetical protein